MSGWSDIPVELIPEITNRLDVVDVIRFDAVCSSWHSVPFNEKTARKYQIPWLISFSSEPNRVNSLYFYSLGEQMLYEINLPDIAGHRYLSSSNGYLLSVDHIGNLAATNPLNKSGTHLSIPHTSTFLEFASAVHDDFGRIVEYKMLGRNGIYTSPVSYVQKNYYTKAILSPNLDAVVAIRGEFFDLSFARIGDNSWTSLKLPLEISELHDMIFHNRLLHVIDFMGTVAVFDLNLPSVEPLSVSPWGPCINDVHSSRYIVESPCKEKLFLVCRVWKDLDDDMSVTCSFKVFLLDKDTYLWKRIYTLGDVTLFLGLNYSLAFSTLEFPYIRRNCIYFSEDHNTPGNDNDKGIFSMEDSSIEPLYEELDQLKLSPPTWFMPALQ